MEKISNEFMHELNWDHDFSQYEDKLLQFAKDTKTWNSSFPKWGIISARNLISIPIFNKINNLFDGINIQQSVIRETELTHWVWPHCDWKGTNEEIRFLPLSLNIPIRSSESALTSWYDFSKDPVYKSWNFRSDLLMTIPERKLSYDVAKPYTIFTSRLRCPTIINTRIPHSAYNDRDDRRIILSVHFSLSWHQRKIFDNINIE
jgi:hypothetical protein